MNTSPALLKSFEERVVYLLGYIYENGGAEYKPMEFNSILSRSICGCDHSDEFERVMYSLNINGWIICKHSKSPYGGAIIYDSVMLTPAGKAEYERLYSKAPMAGLVNQEISTGNPRIDEKINHAKALFFQEPVSMENMRSACVALCAVLEPVRAELQPAISDADVNALFQLINTFDIRHSNGVRHLIYPEQLEWVYYTLLNTINTYTKLKNKQSNL